LSPLLVLACRGPWADGVAAGAALFGAVQDWLFEHVLGAGLGAAADAPSLFGLARALLDDPALQQPLRDATAQLAGASTQASLRIAAIAALYFVGFEAGPWSATPGKRLLGLRVADLAGRPAGPARALARFLGGGLSWLTLNLGHALAGFRRDHRALHDLLAGTQVLGRGPTPRWARGLLAGVLAAAVLVPLALVLRVVAALAGGL
jgi:hypothetical protein